MRLARNSVGGKSTRPASALRARLSVEELESRVVPSATTGNLWPNPQLITLSFVPDGTVVSSGTNGTVTSDMFAKFNAKFGSTAAWENVIIKAAQTWAQYANINFVVVSDNGTALGQGAYQQGDPGMGDIRFAAEPMASNYLGLGYFPPPTNNYSAAGDIAFNDMQTYNINGASYDLYSVALHEIGHALGLDHSAQYSAVMYASYHGTLRALTTDDITGMQAIYGARTGDAYGGSGVVTPDNSFATAADLSAQIDPILANAQVNNLDISTVGQAEYFQFTAPLTSLGSLTVNVQSTGLSLFRPTVTLYAADQTTVLGTATAANSYNGGNLTVTYTAQGLLGLPGSVAGQTFYVKVTGADSTAFGTGRYTLSLNMGLGSLLPVVAPVSSVLDGAVFSGGGGAAEVTGDATSDSSNTVETSDFYETGNYPPDLMDGTVQTAAVSPTHTPAGTATPTVNVVAVVQVLPGGAGANTGTVPGTVVQGFTQAALVLAPPSATPQTGNVVLVAPALSQGTAPALAALQNTQAGLRQTALLVPAAVGSEAATPSLATRQETTPILLPEQNEPATPAEEIPLTPQGNDEATVRQQATDFIFSDPQSLATLGWSGVDVLGLDDGFGAAVLPPVSGQQPPAAENSEEQGSPLLAGLALLGGWWSAFSAPAELRSRSKQLPGRADG